ncbi:MAG: hypothetical protein Q8M15_10805 [Bacteroidota bacterium]|nr:hypothetical protein [Bacteroidota bacterium]
MKFKILFLATVLVLSCSKQESKSDLNIQIRTTVLPAYVILYKNNAFYDSINFQIDGSIGFWDIEVPLNTSYSLEVRKINIKDTGAVDIKWFKSANLAQHDYIKLDSISLKKSFFFKM